MTALSAAHQPTFADSLQNARVTVFWLTAAALLIAAIVLGSIFPIVSSLPTKPLLPLADWIDQALALLAPVKPIFRRMGDLVAAPYVGLSAFLARLPWPATFVALLVGAYALAGRSATVMVAVALSYCLVTGYWGQSMTTLSLATVAIFYSAALGFLLGALGARSERIRHGVEPALDLMQTIPTFAYLIPFLFLFGFGPSVGLLASVIFALPPMVRNTMLGLRTVPPEIAEAAIMAGCTPWQKFWRADVPTARAQILTGLNQTTMAAFAMVIIAALIGGFNDVGWEVLSNIRQARFGGSLLTGLLIVLLAMALDRVTIAAVDGGPARPRRLSRDMKALLGLAAASAVIAGLLWKDTLAWPHDWTIAASGLDIFLNGFVQAYAASIAKLKSILLIYVLLPMKIGLKGVVMPSTWGFQLTPAIVGAYWMSAVAISIAMSAGKSLRAGFWSLFIALLLYAGVTGMPWIAAGLAITALAVNAGGWRLGLLATGTVAFVLLCGLWQSAAISVYLCGVAVVVSVLLGVPIGLLAAWNDRVSWMLRPLCDFFQTVPQFVFLIPVLMLFGVGDFAGLVAIISYSTIPIIRYTEQGIRQVPAALLEVAKMCGCTPRQSFFQVQLPVAKPVLLLGINQAILFSLGMLVIASLVGTEGLGQQIYIALSKNQPGVGLVAGIAMSLIGILADRILRAASAG